VRRPAAAASFTGHDCQSAGYAKLSGLWNGALLTAAEAAGFQVLITTDQGIPNQQNLEVRQISIVILCSATNRLADLTRILPSALLALNAIAHDQVIRVE
jgi:hypothetical protein